MTQPRKIRVIYFDGSAGTLARFINLCSSREIIEIVGAFGGFAEVAPLLEQDDYRFLELLSPDVLVLRLTEASAEVGKGILRLKRRCRVKVVGLLSRECAADLTLTGVLDHHTEIAGADSLTTDEDTFTRLIYQIKTARLALHTEKAGVRGRWAILPPPRKPSAPRSFRLIAVGASAGGTEALTTVLSALPPDIPPVVVVQHIPDNFTAFFSNNLASRVSLRVKIACNGERLEKGTVYIAGNGRHLQVVRMADGGFAARCTEGEKISGHRPSVDALFMSVAKAAGASAIGVILTGMGSDGARGLLEMHEAGAYTIGQDKDTCAVYGMPMVAYTLGAVSKQLPLGSIARAVVSAVSQDRGGETLHE